MNQNIRKMEHKMNQNQMNHLNEPEHKKLKIFIKEEFVAIML